MPAVRSGQHWRHKKTGGLYEIVHERADIQCSTAPEFEAMFEDEVWVAYKPITGHSLYFRLYSEFTDGRFALVKETD